MSLKCRLGFVLLATLAVAEIPSYFKICGRRDPNLDKCIVSAVEALRDKLRTGIPELGAPPIEPLYLETLPLAQTEALTAIASNVNFTGFSDFEVQKFNIDFDKKRFDVVVFFKHLTIDADDDVKAKIVVPIRAHGSVHIVAVNVRADVIMKYKLIRRNGSEYIFLPTMTTKLNINDYTAEFKPDDGADSTIATGINAAIQGGRQEILESITPSIEKVISGMVLKFANNICKHFTFDELFPDRE